MSYKGQAINDFFELSSFKLEQYCKFGQWEYCLFDRNKDEWNVKLVDKGDGTMTGGRLKRLVCHLWNETFMLTHGDGVADFNI